MKAAWVSIFGALLIGAATWAASGPDVRISGDDADAIAWRVERSSRLRPSQGPT